MAKFTETEANNSTIVRAEQSLKNGTHKCWVFGVNDTDGNYCDWTDNVLSGDATDVEQKTTIFTYLTTECDKKPAKVVISTIESDIINTKVG